VCDEEAMSDGDFYAWLKEVRCATVREVAERLGVTQDSVAGPRPRPPRPLAGPLGFELPCV
jgi:hypothetical protein